MAMGEGGGGAGMGIDGAGLARINQQMSPSAKASDFDAHLDSLIGQSENAGTFFGMKLGSIFSTGILAHFSPPQSWFEKSINQGANSMTAKGGRFAEGLAMFKPDFSKLQIPQITGFDISPPVNMSGGDYFTASMAPLPTPMGSGSSPSMGIG